MTTPVTCSGHLDTESRQTPTLTSFLCALSEQIRCRTHSLYIEGFLLFWVGVWGSACSGVRFLQSCLSSHVVPGDLAWMGSLANF